MKEYLKRAIDFLEANFKWVVILAIVILIIGIIRSCGKGRLYDEISLLKGNLEAREQALLQKDRDLETMTKAHEARVAELNAAIDEARGKITLLERRDKNLSGKLSELEEAEATITNKDELITNLRGQIDIWRERFSLAQKTIAEKDAIIFSLTEKYESERKLRLEITFDRDAWKAQYFEMKGLNEQNEKRVLAERRKAKWGRAANYVLAGVAVYGLVKK